MVSGELIDGELIFKIPGLAGDSFNEGDTGMFFLLKA
jgi:hypothetical protein